MPKRDRIPAPIVRKTARGISPASGFDAERVMGDALGTEYDLVKRTRRSNSHQSLYWATLTNVVRATGKWPTPEYLHAELKLICGFRMTVVDWETGKLSYVVDSTAFDAMTQDEFSVFFNLAIAKLNEHLGFDVLSFAAAA